MAEVSSESDWHSFLEKAANRLGVSMTLQDYLATNPSFRPHFHDVRLAVDELGNRYTVRSARPNLLAQRDDRMSHELLKLGYYAKGGSYVLRQPPDQKSVHETCNRHGLNVPRMPYADHRFSLVEFVKGPTLSEVLSSGGAAHLIRQFLEDLLEFQTAGFSLGDRHCSNVIVDSRERLWQIDVDVGLSGPHAFEFEICQAIFYSVYWTVDMDESLAEILEFLRENSTAYRLAAIRFFLRSFCSFKGSYSSGKYDAIIPHMRQLISSI